MTREIKLQTFLIVMVILIALEIFLLVMFRPKQVSENYSPIYCQEAVCNEDASICYAYDLDSEGKTIVVWRGSCQAGN